MKTVTLDYRSMRELKEIPRDILKKIRYVRISLDVSVYSDINNEWDTMSFIHRAEMIPSEIEDVFWSRLRTVVKELFENCDSLYNFSNKPHTYKLKYLPEF